MSFFFLFRARSTLSVAQSRSKGGALSSVVISRERGREVGPLACLRQEGGLCRDAMRPRVVGRKLKTSHNIQGARSALSRSPSLPLFLSFFPFALTSSPLPPIRMRVVGAAVSGRSYPVVAPRSRASRSAGVSALAPERSFRLASRPPTAAKKILTSTTTTSVATAALAASAEPQSGPPPANDAKPFASKSWTWRGFPIKYHESGDGETQEILLLCVSFFFFFSVRLSLGVSLSPLNCPLSFFPFFLSFSRTRLVFIHALNSPPHPPPPRRPPPPPPGAQGGARALRGALWRG